MTTKQFKEVKRHIRTVKTSPGRWMILPSHDPWRYQPACLNKETGKKTNSVVVDKFGDGVMRPSRKGVSYQEQIANCLLTAAAPDMFVLIKKFTQLEKTITDPDFLKLCNKAHQIISKATYETNLDE